MGLSFCDEGLFGHEPGPDYAVANGASGANQSINYSPNKRAQKNPERPGSFQQSNRQQEEQKRQPRQQATQEGLPTRRRQARFGNNLDFKQTKSQAAAKQERRCQAGNSEGAKHPQGH